ncbi:hypothetical protein EVAR_45323_1 [Eumeta japonica]|uniref:Uncharacterized protein n=1 Tax=Eumeta variegata TaxID=151549 RepID=A0A4C1XPZ7_EUMVA|nr:hypothetical protein EVAR_45323_1 [Eumeta japonica]
MKYLGVQFIAAVNKAFKSSPFSPIRACPVFSPTHAHTGRPAVVTCFNAGGKRRNESLTEDSPESQPVFPTRAESARELRISPTFEPHIPLLDFGRDCGAPAAADDRGRRLNVPFETRRGVRFDLSEAIHRPIRPCLRSNLAPSSPRAMFSTTDPPPTFPKEATYYSIMSRTALTVVLGRRRRRTSLAQIVRQISATIFELLKPVINSGKGWSFIVKGQTEPVTTFLSA